MRLNKKRIEDLTKTIAVYGDNTQTVVKLAKDHIDACALLQQLRDRIEHASISGGFPKMSTSQLIVMTDAFLKEPTDDRYGKKPKLSPRKDPNPPEG